MQFHQRFFRRIAIALAGFFCLPLISAAQQYAFSRFSVEHGLAQSQVLAIHQDRGGYLWFGTNGGGATRFDGVSAHSLGAGVGLRSVSDIAEDRDGNLWFATSGGGAVKYDGSQYTRFTEDDGLIDNRISAVLEDRHGNLWFGTWRGLSRYDGTSFVSFTSADGLSDDRVETLLEDRHGNLWIGTWGGASKYDGSGFSSFTAARGLADGVVWEIIEDRSGAIWLAADGGVSVFDGQALVPFDDESLGSSPIYALLEDSRGNMWLGTGEAGALLFDGRGFTRFTTENGLCHDTVNRIVEDREGNIWFGTDGGGACRFRGPSFATFDERDGMIDGSVLSILEDRHGNLWFGTDKGASRTSGSTLESFALESFTVADGLGGGALWSIEEDRHGNLWFGTDDGTVSRYDGRRFEQLSKRYDLGGVSVLQVLTDRQGRLWFATFGAGVRVLDGESLVTITEDDGLSSDFVWTLFEDDRGDFWIATDAGGVDRYDGVTIEHFSAENGFIDEVVLAIAQETDADIRRAAGAPTKLRRAAGALTKRRAAGAPTQLWFGTSGRGLLQVELLPDHKLGPVAAPTPTDALVDDEILSLVFDHQGHLWAGTNRGVVRLDLDALEGKRFKHYGREDGILGIECNQNAALLDSRGNLWFGTIGGATRYDPSADWPNAAEPITHITGIRLFYQDVDWSPYADGVDRSTGLPLNLRLPHSQNHLELQFLGISLTNPDKVRYRYRLQGFDRDWTPVTAVRSATYSNLPPGRYTFLVEAGSGEDVWNRDAASYSFVILGPFWRTWWFTLASPLALAAAVVLLIRLRVRALERKRRELQILVSLRTGELTRETEKVASINAELSAQKERLAVTLRSIGEGVISTDTDGKIVLVNRVAEVLTGWREVDALGKDLSEVFRIFDAETGEPRTSSVTKAIADGGRGPADEYARRATNETRARRGTNETPAARRWSDGTRRPGGADGTLLVDNSGSERFIAYRGAPIRDRSGELAGAVVVFHDVSEEKRVEQELQRAQRLESVGLLAGGIAHDFNNFLTGILGNISLAKMTAAPDGKSADLLAQAERATMRATSLTKQLLTFSRGGLPVKELTAIGRLLEDAVGFALRGSNVKAELSIPDDLWDVEGDEGQLSQVLNNLVINADQAMPEGGQIEVRAENLTAGSRDTLLENGARYVMIAMRDSGIGIAAEQLPKIFDPYFSTKQKGRGLGLATAYSIIKQHDGLITADSELGVGSSFHVYLPAAESRAERGAERPAKRAAGFSRILVMDDEDFIREMLRRILEPEGYEVALSRDGGEAIETYLEAKRSGSPFDLVLVDLTIRGGMGGKEVARRLGEIDPQVKIIVASGYFTDPVVARYREYGFAATLIKPFSPEKLLDVLGRVAAGDG